VTTDDGSPGGCLRYALTPVAVAIVALLVVDAILVGLLALIGACGK